MQQADLTLHEAFQLLWAGRMPVLAGLALGCVVAFLFILAVKPQYEAVMVIAPAQPMQVYAASREVGYTGGRVSQSSRDQSDMNFERFQSVVKGASVAGLLLRSSDITQGLSADSRWRFGARKGSWNAEKLAAYIRGRVHFNAQKGEALQEMRYAHSDPVFAKEFLQRLHSMSDGLIRQDMRRAVTARISYLQDEMAKSRNPEHRRALADLLMEQERLRMMVSLDQPYAATVVENAYSSYAPVRPNRNLVFIGFGFVGAVAGFVVFLFSKPADEMMRKLKAPMSTKSENQQAQRARQKLNRMRRWYDVHGDNNNEARLSAKKPGASEAAE